VFLGGHGKKGLVLFMYSRYPSLRSARAFSNIGTPETFIRKKVMSSGLKTVAHPSGVPAAECLFRGLKGVFLCLISRI